MTKIINNKSGFSLVELIIALGIFSILAAGVFNVVTSSYKNFYGTGDKQVLTEFAQEGIEAVRTIRDNLWQDIEDVSGLGNQGLLQDSNGYWQFSGTSNTLGDFTRVVVISDVSRDSNDEIVSSGGTDDPNTKKAVVTVSGAGIDDYVLTTYLTNWSYKSWTQTDWSGVGSSQFWSDFTMASSSYANVNTSTPGEIVIKDTAGTYEASGYIYSSIYTIGATDKELRSVAVEQDIPSGCDIDITLEGATDRDFTAGISSHVFSDVSSNYYTSSTVDTLNGKSYLRYKLDMTSCNSNADTPTLYSIRINYR